MSQTKEFHIGDVLTVITDRLFSPRYIGGLYDILNWMTGDNLFTHQLPRAAEECKEPLRQQHPDLAGIEVPEFGGPNDAWRWLDKQVEQYGETRDVAPLPPQAHTRIDPIAELRMMRPDLPIMGLYPDKGSS